MNNFTFLLHLFKLEQLEQTQFYGSSWSWTQFLFSKIGLILFLSDMAEISSEQSLVCVNSWSLCVLAGQWVLCVSTQWKISTTSSRRPHFKAMKGTGLERYVSLTVIWNEKCNNLSRHVMISCYKAEDKVDCLCLLKKCWPKFDCFQI